MLIEKGYSNHIWYFVYKHIKRKGICKEWGAHPSNFFKWLEDKNFKKGDIVLRINPSSSYSPDNCFIKEWVERIFKISTTPQYKIFIDMKRRCYDSKRPYYKNYGGRGIKICDEWLSNPLLFFEWLVQKGWRKGLHVDRINNDGDYSPENCQIVTNSENCAIGKRRKRTTNTSGITGVSYDKKGWRARITVNHKTLTLVSGKTKEQAIQTRILTEIFLYDRQLTNLHILPTMVLEDLIHPKMFTKLKEIKEILKNA